MRSAVIAADRRYPAVPLARQPGHERVVRLGPLVLESAPLNRPTPTADTDRTPPPRSEPSSCTTLTGEQPDPWDLLQPQDVISRHRGAKPRRRCELSGAISLLSPAYLLSVARLRYPFGGDRPSQTAHLPRSQRGSASRGEHAARCRVVFHWPLPPSWR